MVDQTLHDEVLTRFRKLNVAPYGGFINPVFIPVFQNNKIIDIRVDYNEGYKEQMMRYSEQFSFLANEN